MREVEKGVISIIVPVHNSSATLAKCVQSLIAQTYKKLEIILVNNGSQDNSLELCYQFANEDKRIIVINLDEGNVSKARNAALDVMQGEYFAFADSDDFVDLTMYEKLYKKASEKLADMVFCKFADVVHGEVFNIKEDRLDDLVFNGQVCLWFLNDENYVRRSACRTLFNASKLGNIRFLENMYSGEDSVYMFDAYSLSKNFDLVDEHLYFYTIADTVYSKKYYSARYSENNKIYAKKSRELLLRFGMEDFSRAVQFNEWIRTIHAALAYSSNCKEDVQVIALDEYWQGVKSNKDYYKSYLRHLCNGFKWHVRAFLLKHGMYHTYKSLIRFILKRSGY